MELMLTAQNWLFCSFRYDMKWPLHLNAWCSAGMDAILTVLLDPNEILPIPSLFLAEWSTLYCIEIRVFSLVNTNKYYLPRNKFNAVHNSFSFWTQNDMKYPDFLLFYLHWVIPIVLVNFREWNIIHDDLELTTQIMNNEQCLVQNSFSTVDCYYWIQFCQLILWQLAAPQACANQCAAFWHTLSQLEWPAFPPTHCHILAYQAYISSGKIK